MSSPSQPPKTSIVDGRAKLHAAGFRHSNVSGGAGGELWFNKYDYPVLISYFGNDYNYFSAESIENAVKIKDEKIK